jgi:hypothetical protein
LRKKRVISCRKITGFLLPDSCRQPTEKNNILMVRIVQVFMKHLVIILVLLLCTAAVPAVTASDNYLGGGVQLGGSGVKITYATTAATQMASAIPAAAEPQTGSLSVTTTPPGATLVIDRVQRGVSPATITGLSPGSHVLVLSKDGYKDLTVMVTVTAGKTETYSTSLEPAAPSVPALPSATRAPGFGMMCIAAIGAVLLLRRDRP